MSPSIKRIVKINPDGGLDIPWESIKDFTSVQFDALLNLMSLDDQINLKKLIADKDE